MSRRVDAANYWPGFLIESEVALEELIEAAKQRGEKMVECGWNNGEGFVDRPLSRGGNKEPGNEGESRVDGAQEQRARVVVVPQQALSRPKECLGLEAIAVAVEGDAACCSNGGVGRLVEQRQLSEARPRDGSETPG